MKKLRKPCAALLLMMCFIAAVSAKTVYAADNHVTNLDIEVEIRKDGSAWVVQHWMGEFQTGTENYIPIRTGDIEISEFAVADENGAYLPVSDWNVDAGFDEKKGKCGIVTTKEGVELCFGITEYGHKEYTISYLVTDFIKGYTDANGTNFMFVNPDMSTFPTAGSITIWMEDGTPLSASNAGIWAFGFEGMAEFSDGCAYAYTTRDLEGSNSMIVMLQLEKSLLSPDTVLTESFDEVKNRAMEDSNYGHGGEKENLTPVFVGLGVVVGGVAAAIGSAVVYSAKRKKEFEEFGSGVGYFDGIPNHGKLELTHYLARTFDISKEDSALFSACMISMMNERAIELRGALTETGEEYVELRLLKEPEGETKQKLFQFFSQAAKQGVLGQKTLDEYVSEHYENLQNIMAAAKEDGKAAMKQEHGFIKKPGSWIHHLSETGKQELSEVIGLHKYLTEHVSMENRTIWEANLWQEYMVYAALFGIADKALEQLKEIFPEHLPEWEERYHGYYWCFLYYQGLHHSYDKAVEATRAEGGGGASSVGGGGGFSGGGCGGGSR